jgi:hypothetical protein
MCRAMTVLQPGTNLLTVSRQSQASASSTALRCAPLNALRSTVAQICSRTRLATESGIMLSGTSRVVSADAPLRVTT